MVDGVRRYCAEVVVLKVLIGSKIGMTQVCDSAGTFEAVTVVQAGPCEVLCIRTKERDGYEALQVGYGDRRVSNRQEKAKTGKRFIREIPKVEGAAIGDKLTVASLEGVKKVDVVGVSKGRGFSGVIKRHNFGGLCASHGVKKVHRSGGSTGNSTDPGRVFKGTKMPGRYGGVRVTVKALRVAGMVADENLLILRGAVPGFNGGYVTVRESV